ncbi:glycerate kinase [Paenibacillus cremeus]|uniref:Glycerate kinase n=1 Tax=Paenibacillus cremeus TaxID=2163881 RepID=A0A559KBE4_9BACL|nr:glycerate kinase [Paenibacillus cremeus]TVY09413.1 glycerate kinase [Paenibacillus cremeus]
MKFVIAPDSYKGSLSAVEVGETMARAVLAELPLAEVRVIPMADGGEGTVDALVGATHGSTVAVQAVGPMGEPVDTYFGVLPMGEGHAPVVVLEAANIFGLPMVAPEQRNPLYTTSRGMGDVIRAALDQGYRQFVIGLGGSSTNDGGLGMLSALGARFTDRDGTLAEGFGRELATLAKADLSGLDPRLGECRLTVACDVTNPLLGPQGASHIFGPQKGATPELVQHLDQALGAYADLVEGQLSLSLREHPGAGAAGGLGFALLALGAKLVPGAEVVEQMTGLKQQIAEADWVLTGEGRSDGQTLFGKLPFHVAQVAKEAGKGAILISGGLGDGSEALNAHFAGCFSIVRGPASLQACMEEAEFNLFECTRSVVRLIGVASQRSCGGEPR